MKRKTSSLVLLILVASLLLPIFSATAADAPVEISIAWWGGEARHVKFNAILDRYEELNPNVTFIRQYSPWTDYWAKLMTQAASNSLPDTFGMTAPYKNEFDARGAMISLQPYVDSGIIDLSAWSQGAIDAGYVGGEFKFITFGNTVNVLNYNKTLLDSVGMEPPTGSMTYSEFIAYCEALLEKLPEGIYPTNYFRDPELHMLNYGMQLVSEDGKEPGYTKEALKSYYEFLYTLYEKKLGPPVEVLAEDSGKAWSDSLTGQGKIALHLNNLNQLKIWQADGTDDLGAVRGIVADNATNVYIESIQPSGWAISPNSNVKEETAKFLNYFVNDLEAQEIFYMDLGVPGSDAVQQAFLDKLDDSNPTDRAIAIEINLIAEILANVEPYGGRKEGAVALYDDIVAKWDEIVYGITTIDQAVEDHFNNASTILY